MITYFWSFKSPGFLSCLLVMLFCASLIARYSYSSRSSCEIEFIFNTPEPVDFGIYYDIGEGLSQKYHQQQRVDTIDEKTSISFCIASYRQLHTIRFDPAMSPIAMDIYSITLRYSNGNIFEVPFDTLQPGAQIETFSWDEEKFSFITTSDANDPTFVLTRLNSGEQPDDTTAKMKHYGSWLISAVLLTMVGRFFILFFCLGRGKEKEKL